MTQEERTIVKQYLYTDCIDTQRIGRDKLFSFYSAKVNGFQFTYALVEDSYFSGKPNDTRIVPDTYGDEIVSAVVVDYDKAVNHDAFCGYLIIPNSIEVIVLKSCSNELRICLQEPNNHPVFKYASIHSNQIIDERNLVFCNITESPELTQSNSISKIILGDKDILNIPANIEALEDYAVQGDVDVVDIQGRTTVFTNHSFVDLRVNKLVKINKTRHEVGHLLQQFRYDGDYRHPDPKIILKAPELDSTASINPGFIRATCCNDDNILEINILNITCYSSEPIIRYDGIIEGSRIYFSSSIQEHLGYIVVYESPKVIAEKIKESMDRFVANVGSIPLLAEKMTKSINNNLS